MSRTNHHRGQHTKFGSSKFSCNKQHSGVVTREAKVQSHRQMRCEGKSDSQDTSHVEEYWHRRNEGCGFPDDDDCVYCGADWLSYCKHDCMLAGMTGIGRVWEFPIDYEDLTE